MNLHLYPCTYHTSMITCSISCLFMFITCQVKDIVRDNIRKVEERGDKLDDLDVRAEYLRNEGTHFEKTAIKVRKSKQCQHIKLWIILASVIFVILLVIVIIAVILGVVLNRP